VAIVQLGNLVFLTCLIFQISADHHKVRAVAFDIYKSIFTRQTVRKPKTKPLGL